MRSAARRSRSVGRAPDWVDEAAWRLTAEDSTLDDVAGWLGGVTRPEGPGRLLVERPERTGAVNVVLAEEEGRPASLSAWYARGEGPTVDEAARVLGAWREYPRPGPPYQGGFPRAQGCEVSGTTYDPPGDGSGRRLVEVAVLRSPFA